jgi:predicted DNA-binding transcriptional regulator YafY
MARLRKSNRVLAILRQLLDGHVCEVEKLANDLEVSSRSIFRDLATLKGAGFDIERSGAQIVLKLNDRTDDSNSFTNAEILLLQIILENAQRENGLLRLPVANSLRDKLMKRLPQLQRMPAAYKHRVSIKSMPITELDGCGKHFETVMNCILNEQSMACVYEPAHSSKDEKQQKFQFEPYELVFASHAWFVIGRRHDREQFRTLKLNRFSEAKGTGRKFKRRRDFSLDDYLKDAWRIIRGKPTLTAELIFAREFADNIEETIWHKNQATDPMDDGRLKFSCKVDGMEEIKWWILSMGPKCEVIAPAELRLEVHRLAKEAAEVNRP